MAWPATTSSGGGLGINSLTGGPGSDSFCFNTAPSASTSNRDIVFDFTHGVDKFWMENAVYAKLGAATGALNPAFFRVGAAALDGNDYIVYNKASGALFYDSNGSLAGGVMAVAVLANKPVLTASDFLVICVKPTKSSGGRRPISSSQWRRQSET